MPTAALSGMAIDTIEYEKKVREIAVAQCRCQTGADLEVDKPKDGHAHQEHPKAA